MKTTPAFWKTFAAASAATAALAFYQTFQRLNELNVVLWRSRWLFLLALLELNVLAGALALWKWVGLQIPRAGRLRAAAPILLGLSLTPLVRHFFFGDILPQYAPALWVFLWGTLLAAAGLALLGAELFPAFLFLLAAQGILYQIYANLTAVSAYPFSIGYSEASRHYYASMFYAARIYQMDLPLPFLHPSRYLLLSLPFAIQSLPLWAHRLWQALLWILLPAASALLLARRMKVRGWTFFFAAAWAYLYFMQGAVYYHLHVMVILILIGVKTNQFWRTLFFVILASLWAGMSRVNWFPVPAMLTIALYALETPLGNNGWRYWLAPFAWGIFGLAAALIAQIIYIQISGNADASNFASSFTSDLIWARLLPNEIFSGVLVGAALVSAPVLFALSRFLRGGFARVHLLRWLTLTALLGLLLAGGLVVSVKIGGGADLHNLDAFMVLLALTAAALFAGQVYAEDGQALPAQSLPPQVLAALFFIPLMYVFPRVGSFYSYDKPAAQADVQTLRRVLDETPGEVLFVTERQLFTFGELPAARMVGAYEQIELMEFAMSGNRAELEKFYADLSAKRFAVIVAEEQKFVLRKEGAFKEENNAWVRYVGAPLLCAYKPIETLKTANVQIFVPRPNPKCKNPFEE
ncbi:MAG: hypothetical protein Fur002_12290 [Anaerolineales bacterium]